MNDNGDGDGPEPKTLPGGLIELPPANERQFFDVELPRGAQVVGLSIVYVEESGTVHAVVRHRGKEKRERQAFYQVLAQALENYRVKHKLTCESELVVRREGN